MKGTSTMTAKGNNRLLPLSRIAAFMGLCAFSSCAHDPTPEMIKGEYVFQYPSGHVEVLILDENLTYQQQLYPNIDGFQSIDSVMFSMSGTWSLGKGEITLYDRLRFSGGGGPLSPDLHPRQGSIMNIGWIAPTPSDPALLEFPADYPYYFVRVSDRNNLPPGITEQAMRRKR